MEKHINKINGDEIEKIKPGNYSREAEIQDLLEKLIKKDRFFFAGKYNSYCQDVQIAASSLFKEK